MANLKYGCFLTNEVENRCMNVVPGYKGNQYETLQDCIKDCNTSKEQVKLKNLKKKFRLKSLPEFIRPSLIESFDKMIDIPILNYDDKLYTKPILNYDEFRGLYMILATRSAIFKNSNPFLENIIESLNGIIGIDLVITILIKSEDDISISDNLYFHFEDDDYREKFNKEIDDFNKSSKLYLVKNINIVIGKNDGHHTILLIKKNEAKLDIFMYDPTSNIGFDDKISKRIEQFMNQQLKINFSFLNLSKIYGLQDFEELDTETKLGDITRKITNHFYIIDKAFYKILTKIRYEEVFIDTMNLAYRENASHNFILKLMDPVLHILGEDHFLKNYMESKISEMNVVLTSIFEKQSFILSTNVEEKVVNLRDSMVNLRDEYIDKHINRLIKDDLLFHNIRSSYNYDIFQKNCYMWSYYTIILILINKTIKPYDIIKSSYYQSSELNNMKAIFNNIIKDEIEYTKNKENLFSNRYFTEKNDLYEDLKNKFESHSLNNSIYEHKRIIYVKVTNLILLNILYNRIDNKYLLFSLKTECYTDFCITSFIPEKVNDIIDKLSFDRNKLTKEKILENILKGIPINDLNSLILLDKTSNKSNYKIPSIEVESKLLVNTPSPPLENILDINNSSLISPTKTSQLKNILGINNSSVISPTKTSQLSVSSEVPMSIYLLSPLFGKYQEIIYKGKKEKVVDLRVDFFVWAIVQEGLTKNNRYLHHSSAWNKSAAKNALVGGKQYPEDKIDPEIYIFINDVASRVQKLDNEEVMSTLNNLADKELDSSAQFIIKSLFKTINGKKPDSIIRTPIRDYKYNDRINILENFNTPDFPDSFSSVLALKRICYSKNPINFTFNFNKYNKLMYNKYLKYKNKYIELKSIIDKKIDYN